MSVLLHSNNSYRKYDVSVRASKNNSFIYILHYIILQSCVSTTFFSFGFVTSTLLYIYLLVFLLIDFFTHKSSNHRIFILLCIPMFSCTAVLGQIIIIHLTSFCFKFIYFKFRPLHTNYPTRNNVNITTDKNMKFFYTFIRVTWFLLVGIYYLVFHTNPVTY